MNEILEWLVEAEDPRQQAKVKHLMKDIIATVFFGELANATEWIEIQLLAQANEEALREYSVGCSALISTPLYQLYRYSRCCRPFRRRQSRL